MTQLAKAVGATAAVAGLVAVGWVLWLMDWDCCPHDTSDDNEGEAHE